MTAPAGHVKVPGIGAVHKQAVMVGVGGAVVLGLYSYNKRKNAAAANATTATVNNLDPATGLPYGSAADAQALADQANFQMAGNSGGSSSPTPQPTVQGFTNNSQWSQAAQQYIVQSANGDPGTVATALGKYLAGEVVTDNERAIVEQAIAFEGHPPTAGTTGFPPAIRTAPPVPTPKTPNVGTPSGVKFVQSYTTVTGDTLRNISQRTFGTANNWWSIWSYNPSLNENPDIKIKPGTHIRIPHPN